MLDRVGNRLVNDVHWNETSSETATLHREKFNSFYEDLVFSALDTGLKEGKALDLGTQFGLCASNLGKQNFDFEITSMQDNSQHIKLSREMSEKDMTNDKIKWIEGKPEVLPFKDKTFDLIISGFAMHHWENPVNALNEIERVLKMKGTLILADFRRDAFSLMAPIVKGLSYAVKNDRIYGQIKSAYNASYTRTEVDEMLKNSNIRECKTTKDVQFIYVKRMWKGKKHVIVEMSQ